MGNNSQKSVGWGQLVKRVLPFLLIAMAFLSFGAFGSHSHASRALDLVMVFNQQDDTSFVDWDEFARNDSLIFNDTQTSRRWAFDHVELTLTRIAGGTKCDLCKNIFKTTRMNKVWLKQMYDESETYVMVSMNIYLRHRVRNNLSVHHKSFKILKN